MSTLIVGGRGQDGQILQRILRAKGDEPYILDKSGLVLGLSKFAKYEECKESYLTKFLVESDLEAIYFLAAKSNSSLYREPSRHEAFAPTEVDPVHTLLLALLNSISHADKPIKFFNTSSSLIFAGTKTSPQNEETEAAPLERYAQLKIKNSKLIEMFVAEGANLHFINGILYNHESIYRKPGFLSSYVINAAIDRKFGLSHDPLKVRAFEVRIDMSYAEDMVRNIVSLMETDAKGSFIFASGNTISVRDFCDLVFNYLGLSFGNYCVEPEEVIANNSVVLRGDTSKLQATLPKVFNRSAQDLVKALVEDWLTARELKLS